jgi:hypothetical protein
MTGRRARHGKHQKLICGTPYSEQVNLFLETGVYKESFPDIRKSSAPLSIATAFRPFRCEFGYRRCGRLTNVSIDADASLPAADFFNCGSSEGTQRTKALGLVNPYLSHEPRLITLICRHCVTSFWRAGSHSAREGNFPRDLKSSGPTTGPCSILIATLGLLMIFSSGAIRYQVCA